MTKWLTTWLIGLLSLLLAIALSNHFAPIASHLPASPAATTELRGVWLTNINSAVLFNPWGIDRALYQLAQLNFNTVYPVVWNRGHTFYPSSVAKEATGQLQDPFLNRLRFGDDVLARIIRQGHRQQLRVIPWFEYGFMAPAQSSLVQTHPDWVTKRLDGSEAIGNIEEQELPNTPSSPLHSALQTIKRTLGTSIGHRVWLNPLHPDVQQFLLNLIVEVVNRYDIEGIQLDDHFGLPVDLGYDDFTIQLYQTEHNGLLPPTDPQEAEWMQWRAAKLSEFMQRLFQTVKSLNPDCLVTLSPNPHQFAYRSYLQDWQTWVENGWVEELILQAYRNDINAFKAELKRPAIEAAREKIPVGIGIFSGSWGRPVSFEQIQQQVDVAREKGFTGVAFFYWESLWGYITPESPRMRRSRFQALFSATPS
ncbi:family 10 glycosylhydrolase [Oculatella sp. LEGE 06141]|uniref:glycoside hydrolase family 10 protein n=1 Tax=Oculatella sp. LEGE 06141 TaxID=1828648 RepID=UPI00187E7455|nr:family 10 glycosylhydrolase [Oculatella sp. LEGE 06141]MBE9180414.1 family 10 glycosylhydrolase [Oculatella sp. LEGE 06141]